MFPFTQRVSKNQLSISSVDGVVQIFTSFVAYDYQEESLSIFATGAKNPFSTLRIFDLALSWTWIAGFAGGRSPSEPAGPGCSFIWFVRQFLSANVFFFNYIWIRSLLPLEFYHWLSWWCHPSCMTSIDHRLSGLCFCFLVFNTYFTIHSVLHSSSKLDVHWLRLWESIPCWKSSWISLQILICSYLHMAI